MHEVCRDSITILRSKNRDVFPFLIIVKNLANNLLLRPRILSDRDVPKKSSENANFDIISKSSVLCELYKCHKETATA